MMMVIEPLGSMKVSPEKSRAAYRRRRGTRCLSTMVTIVTKLFHALGNEPAHLEAVLRDRLHERSRATQSLAFAAAGFRSHLTSTSVTTPTFALSDSEVMDLLTSCDISARTFFLLLNNVTPPAMLTAISARPMLSRSQTVTLSQCSVFSADDPVSTPSCFSLFVPNHPPMGR